MGEGFKISIHHHFDRPTIALQELNMALGQEMQVSVNPVIQTTSDIARTRFSPAQRGCYFQVSSGGWGQENNENIVREN